MADLFKSESQSKTDDTPLADRLRPRNFDEVIGQDHLLGNGGPLRRMVEAGKVSSLIFWGPPGTGKTTMARLLADVGELSFVQISAIFSGVADLKKIFEAARLRRQNGQKTLLFVDEIHRFNRAQQDSFLPHVEDGTITLVGATTENPSFELNAALLSRMQVLVLKRLDEPALEKLIERAESLIDQTLPVDDKARALLMTMADGDGRYLLNMVEGIFDLLPETVPDPTPEPTVGRPYVADGPHPVSPAKLPLPETGSRNPQSVTDPAQWRRPRGADLHKDANPPLPETKNRRGQGKIGPAELLHLVQRRSPAYDKDRDGHYNLISALHKSLRGSDADAALYWLARMLVGGEDPLYIARRLIRFASEDIGLADPQALPQALAAREAYEVLGSPEGELAIVQATLYLATAPKSNAAYTAQKKAWQSAKKTGSLMPPPHILNAPTKLMKDLGYGKDYTYDHDTEQAFSGQNYFPEDMRREDFYQPVERGFEREVRKRLEYWAKKRKG
jgi:putative ATPase